jgi:hypothetical protein
MAIPPIKGVPAAALIKMAIIQLHTPWLLPTFIPPSLPPLHIDIQLLQLFALLTLAEILSKIPSTSYWNISVLFREMFDNILKTDCSVCVNLCVVDQEHGGQPGGNADHVPVQNCWCQITHSSFWNWNWQFYLCLHAVGSQSLVKI